MTTRDDTYPSVPGRAGPKEDTVTCSPASRPCGHYGSHPSSYTTPLNLLAFQAPYAPQPFYLLILCVHKWSLAELSI